MLSPQLHEHSDSSLWAVRTAWCFVGVTLIVWAYLFLESGDTYPWLALVGLGATCFGLATIVASWMSPLGSPHPVMGWAAVVLTLGAFFVWSWLQLRHGPGYGTDEVAFDQYAAQLFAHGHNPYAHSMAPALRLFHVSQYVTTFRLDGSALTSLSYPALSFLVYVPFVLLGWTTQLAVVVNVVAWAISVALAYLLLPRSVKPLAIVLGLSAIYVDFALGGVSDALYVPLLIVAVYQWDRFPELTGWRSWVSPTAMGLALSVKQTPWLVLPFLVLGLYLDANLQGKRGAGGRIATAYVARALVPFLALNLPFIVVDPKAWFDGALSPIVSNLIPEGQGLIALSTFMGIGGGTLLAFTALLACAIVCAIVLFTLGYPRTKTLMVLMPAFVFVFAARSFTSYLVMLILPAIIAACSVKSPTLDARGAGALMWGTLRRRAAVCGSVGLVVVALIVAIAWPPPLRLSITSVYGSGSSFAINRVAIMATNRTSQTVHPVFTVKIGGQITAPWMITTGPANLAPGQAAGYVIQAPNVIAQQAGYGGFQVVALTTSPAAMSVSSPYVPTVLRLQIDPVAVNRPVAPGVPIAFVAQLVNQADQPVHRAGIPVYFHAVSRLASVHSNRIFAIVNGGRIGGRAVEATTNVQGIARFVVTGTGVSLEPIYFQAYLFDRAFGVPYSRSASVSVVFSAGSSSP